MNIFSGIRPSGTLHLGNYLGAVKQWINLQDEADQMIVAVVDHHAITTSHNPEELKQLTKDTIRDYLAVGVNPEKSSMIIQSWIPEHTELAWIFEALTPLSWFEKVPTYKEKVAEQKTTTVGLLAYPALMAADILLYNTTHVPVGEDQRPHIELTRNIAKRLNEHYNTALTIPEEHIPNKGEGARIMSLSDPTVKMSKSGDGGIALSDTPDTIRAKIKTAVTDSSDEVIYDPEGKPGISNLLEIGSLLSGKPINEIVDELGTDGYGSFKEGIAELVIDALAPIREKRDAIDETTMHDIIADGVGRAQEIAQKTLTDLKEQLGFIPRR